MTTWGGFTRSYTPQGTLDYEEHVAVCAKQAGATPSDKPCIVTVNAFFRIPKSKSKKWRTEAEKGLLPCTKKPDCDNIGKIVCDALNKIAYIDDSQVYFLSVSKGYSVEPHIEVEISYDEEGE